jgi:NADP-dependent aldehyde dehydrogenase
VPVGNDLFAVPLLFDAANSHGSQSKTQRSGLVIDNRLTSEVFGPAIIALGIGDSLGVPGALTRTFVVPRSGGRAAEFDGIRFEGRTIVGGVPTGVRVCTSMVHGGPYPASNAPQTTAVGPLAIERWCRPVCWQNTPQSALPWELQNRNPHKLMRMINGKWSRASV